jgi:hypothetical protein
MKQWFNRIVYILFFATAIAVLIWAHVARSAEWNLVGFLLLAMALFFAHWPLSWKN